MPDYQIEAELFQPPPRRVKRRGTRGCGTLFSQFLVLPVFVIALLMPLWGVHRVLVRTRGPIVPCRIVDRYWKYNEDHDEKLYYLAYRFTVNGREYNTRELVDHALYLKVPTGTAAQVQVSPLWPSVDPLLMIPGLDTTSLTWVVAVGGLAMFGLTGMLLWYIYILPARRKRLAINGVPVAGTLTDKSKYVGAKTQSYNFIYQYEAVAPAETTGGGSVSASRQTFIGVQSVRNSDWDKPQIGETYTILYDPKNPQFSVMYLYGDYMAI